MNEASLSNAKSSETTRTDKSGEIAMLLDKPTTSSWQGYPLRWLAAIILLIISGGILYWQAQQSSQASPIYVTQSVKHGNLTLTVTANGTIQPTRAINIGSELSGSVLKVNVDVNDSIKKGQVLIELDPAKLRDQILRSEATLAVANANVMQTTATVTEAKANLARLVTLAQLSGGKMPAQIELDNARAKLDRASADVLSALANVDNAKAALSSDKINLSKLSIRAPTDGVILTRHVDPGNAVAASLQAVTLFTVAENLTKLRLWVYVDEADVGAVKVGQDATFTVSAYPSRQFPARVTRVGFGSTITDNVVTYLTYLDINNDDLSLRPGMTVTATITATQKNNVLMVPNSALRFTPGTANNPMPEKGFTANLLPRMPGNVVRRSAATNASTALAKQVWILTNSKNTSEKLLVPIPVVPGISDGQMTEIVSGDLKEGMQVVTGQRTSVQK